MSAFTDLIMKSNSRYTTLIKIGHAKQQKNWPNYTAGIWQWPQTTDWTNFPVLCGLDMPSGAEAVGEPEAIPIETVKMGTEFLSSQISLANCLSTNKSYYNDILTQTIYVHCDAYNDPDIYVMLLGTTLRAASRAIDLDGYYWEPRLIGTPTIELTRDPLLYDVMAFDGGNVELDNHDGWYDYLKDWFVYGQPLELRFGGDDLVYADYRLCFKGYILDAEIGEESIMFEAIDKRYELNVKIPPNRYTVADWPYLNYKNIGKVVPLAWGVCKNVPCVCTNEDQPAPGSYSFKICDVTDHGSGIGAITTVYVNGEAKSTASTNLTTATFTLSTANYAPGRTVTADITGYNITNSQDIIEDIIDSYTDITFSSTYFDLTEWNAATSATIGLHVGEEKTVSDVISLIMKSNAANFVAKDSGLYTWKHFDAGATLQFTADKQEVSNLASSDQDYDNYLTSVQIGYSKDWAGNSYSLKGKTDLAAGIYQKYGQYRQYELETLLTSSTDAETLAAWIMNYMKDSRQIIENELPVKYIETEIADIVELNGDRATKSWMGAVRCEVIGIKKQLGDEPKVIITGREVPA